MTKEMSNIDIREYEGGDFAKIDDNYTDRQIQAAIANRAEKAFETFEDLKEEVEELKNNPDVVDIVATYADLQAYDTQHLTDKDIIRVLADENHDGDSTYYRYTKSSDSFTYIGESKQYTDFVGTDGTVAGTSGLVPAPATTDAGKFLKADGTWDTAGGGGGDTVYSGVTTSNSATGGAVYIGNLDSSQVEQADPTTTDSHYKYFWSLPEDNTNTPRNDTINIMGTVGNGTSVAIGGKAAGTNAVAVGFGAECGSSGVAIGQKAKGAIGNFNNSVSIGRNTIANASYSMHIGSQASNSNGIRSTASTDSIAIGRNSKVENGNNGVTDAIALGAYSLATRSGELNIGTNGNNKGFNSTDYRLISGVHDGQTAHDAATVGQLDGRVLQNASAPTTATVGTVGQLFEDTTNGKLYQCTAVDTTDPQNPSYTWTEVGAGGGGGVVTLTSADYNWNAQTQSTENPNCIGQWLLDDGYYVLADALSVCGSPDELSASAENGSLLVSSTTDTGLYGEYITKKCTWIQYGSMYQRVYNYNNSRENGWFYESFYQWPTSGDISGIIQGAIRTDYGDYTPDEDTWGSDGQLLSVIDTEQRTVRMFVCAGGDWDETQQKSIYHWFEIPVNPITPNN